MSIQPMLRLLRRPQIQFCCVCFFIVLLALARTSGTQAPGIASVPLFQYFRTSPYYASKDQSASRFYSWETPSLFPPLKGVQKGFSVDMCENFPTHLLNKVQVVMKTGAGESAKTRANLDSVSSCITNILVFSDVEDWIGGHQAIDILAGLPPSYHDNPDFAAYSEQKKAHLGGRPVAYSAEGWKLDRFKFLPMVDEAYKMRPHADWYVFIEADVYYFWDTLLRLLHQLDPSKPHYMGSPAAGRDGVFFAYGGAGFVLSRGLMQRLTGGDTQLSVRYQEYAENDCCGDAALGYAIMNQTGEALQALYPTFAGDELNGLKVDRERWCIPLLALHRVTPDQMKALWTWERTRPYDQYTLTHSTVLDYIMADLQQAPMRASWDNFADDVQPEDSPAHSSQSECRSACETNADCLQYSFSAGTCKFGHSVQMGRPVSDPDHTSGWMIEKLYELGYQKDVQRSSSCKTATWVRPNQF